MTAALGDSCQPIIHICCTPQLHGKSEARTALQDDKAKSVKDQGWQTSKVRVNLREFNLEEEAYRMFEGREDL